MKFIKLYENYMTPSSDDVLKKIHNDEAFEILDRSKASGTTWQEGGCWVLADALVHLWGSYLYVVFNKKMNRIEHFIVKNNDEFFDSDGYQDEWDIIEKINDEQFGKYHISVYDVLPYDKSMNTSDIVRDVETSLELSNYFKSGKLLESQDVLDKFNTYRFDNKIKQNKNHLVKNAINIKEVVHTACDWTLDRSSHIFMFEIAMVESGLGVSSKSRATRGNIGRGIWHVDKGTFEWTQKAHPRINKALENLKKKGLDWSTVDWNDISNNILIGAIACKLVLLKKGLNLSSSVSLNSREKRAKYYSVKYNGGGTSAAETNYLKNTIGWYNVMLKAGAEYLNFRGKKYNITTKGLALNKKLV